ncbi:trypsin-like peptidase domain-containing protein [Streptomyces griseorubiginosus]|uniref:VMAP-C domain-containing protein n=1 Tax=Streptomyces griseorubiginosus TaxID=67304 RepID=UPI002E81697D|nr:trypsin-like peptidase domain-containing protein [Streptomyces griseorubiginosus]WUB47333.1 serine protease [Streptomyces griseorubiginosus]WUB55857.1 serine protease [Streptomyces griseorubiginosus]
MRSAAWHARIVCGPTTGTGFLVTERHVMTCAHVVARSQADPIRVTFAHRGAESVGARVVAHGGWDGRTTDTGDVAVLELDRKVRLKPAQFAASTDAFGHPPHRLVAYGFPKAHDDGTFAEYRATYDQLIAGDWIQVEAWAAHGQPLVRGFSGAALTLAETGQVVGMVTEAARDPAIRNGRMLPVQVLARYWPPLAELIPTPGFTREEKTRLRESVTALSVQEERDRLECHPERLYRTSVGSNGPDPTYAIRSLWDAVCCLLFEVPQPSALVNFTERLADFAEDVSLRGALRSWSHQSYARPNPSAPVRPAGTTPPWSPILVEISQSGSGEGRFMVEVSVYDGQYRRMVGSRTLPAERVRGYALERIDDAYRLLDQDARELIAFVLPRRWLNTGVARWPRSDDDASPLGAIAPVVVLDLERRRSGVLQRHLTQNWRRLDTRAAARMQRVGCESTGQDPQEEVKLTIELRGDADVVGFGVPPRGAGAVGLFRATLNAAVPVLVWPHSGCQGRDSHEDCRGATFLDRLAEHLSDLPPGELPHHVRLLREKAYTSQETEPHWAYDLALLWEDPRCLPDPVGYRHTPVADPSRP